MGNKPFLALITPIGDAGEGGGGGGPQPPLGIWGPTDPRPTHPIAGYPWPQPPQPPLGIWGPTDPRPGWGLPGNQPYPDQGLPGNQPYPDQGLPGWQPRPDQGLPPFPSNPIYIPIVPPTTDPDAPHPEHPIYIPIPVPPNLPPAQVIAAVKKWVEFWQGNMPTDPNPKPEPV